MRSAIILFLLLIALPAHADGALAALEREQLALYDRIAPSVVYIQSSDSAGSGFVVGHEGLILTNAHVVGKADVVDVIRFDGQRRKGRVVERAASTVDLALIDMGKHDLPSLTLSLQELRIGTWAGAIGHGLALTWTFTSGMISNIYPSSEPKQKGVFQTQIPVNPGNSGGPIFDRHGAVLGILTSGIKDAQAVNFAIRAQRAIEVLPRLRDACECLVILAPDGVDVYVDGAVAGKGPKVTAPVSAGRHEIIVIVDGKARTQTVSYPTVRRVDLRIP
jgi:serine protease Do